MALDRLKEHNPDFDYELVGWAEIDKYAIQAHDAVYPQWKDRNFGDISKIDWEQVPDFDLFTYSSPCQDFSQAGKQAGGTEGSGTRSSLLWECRRAILAKRPKYLLMENVAALVSQKFIRLFNAWQLELESYGYRNTAKVLNAKDYGVPQNRERIFMVSVLDESFRYEFPKPMPLTLRLKDVLEKEVAERYYLSDEALEGFKAMGKDCDGAVKVVGELQADNRWGKCIRQQNFVIGTDGVSMAITAKHLMHEFKVAEPVVLGWVRDEKGNVVKRPVVEVANCVTSGKRDNTQNFVLIPQATKDGYIPMEMGGVCDLSYPKSKLRRGRVQEGGTVAPTLTCGVEHALYRVEPFIVASRGREPQVMTPKRTEYGKQVRKQYEAGEVQEQRKNIQQLEPRTDGICNTLTSVQKDNLLCEPSFRIRKLTERECFRLMDMPEHYIDRIQEAGISRSQQYKMAGNSIVVACLYYIFDRLFINTQPTELTLF